MAEQTPDPIVQELLAREIITPEQAALASQTLADNRQAGQQALAGKRYELDMQAYAVRVFSYPEAQLQATIELPRPANARWDAENWELTGTHVTLFNLETSKKQEDIEWRPGPIISVVDSGRGLFLDGPFLSQSNLPLVSYISCATYPKQAQDALPLELLIAPSRQRAAVLDRGAGVIHLLDLNAGQLVRSVEVRKPGSSKGLSAAFAEQKSTLYVSDGSSSFSAISLTDGSVRKVSPGVGLLGSLVVTRDESQLYFLTTKPNASLRVLDLVSEQVAKEIAIKGDLFSASSDDPSDLLALSPDGENLLLMTYLNEPEPFTPVISVIQASKQKTTQRFAIKDGTKPLLLAFAGINPLAEKNQSVVELLLGLGLVTDDDLYQARVAVRQKNMEEAQRSQEAAAAAAPLVDLDQRAFEEAQREQEEKAEAPEEEADPNAPPPFKPEKAPQLNISPAADELITKFCAEQVFKMSQGELDLIRDPDLTEPLQRLQAAATRARNEIEWHTGAIIKLRNLVDELHLEVVITREQVENMLHKHERDSLVKDGLKTVPSNCPNCAKPLFGSYICSYCGYEVERPEELLKRGLISIATIGPIDNLPLGHFLMIDIEGKRIIEVDEKRNIFWSVGKDVLTEAGIELNFPRDAVRLATRNTLITDYSDNHVFEITPSGRRFWDFNTSLSDHHRLANPVRATANGLNHVLIVDQGHHRVIEVDRDSDILRSFGEQGKPGIEDGLLNTPSDVQRLVNGNVLITDTGNHRIVEFEDKQIVWQYGNADNATAGAYGNGPDQLSYPQSALRLDNGNTLIVDAGNLRVMEVSQDKALVWEHSLAEGPDEERMDAPFRAAYMRNGLVMVLGESSVIEYDPREKKVVWSCMMSDFAKAQVQLKADDSARKVFMRHGVRNPYMRTADKTDEADAKAAEATQRMQELLAKRLASRGTDTNKAHITILGDKPKLETLEFYLVERMKNRIVRTNRDGILSWRYGEASGQTLNKPHACLKTPQGQVLISDTDNHRIILVEPSTSAIVWQLGETGKSGNGADLLNRPRSAQMLANGNLLVVDQNNRRVFEITRAKEIVWSFEGLEHLSSPYQAQKLDSGNVLITDWGAHYVFEINLAGEIVWSFGEKKVAGADDAHLSYPESAQRLPSGNTLIVDTRNERILEVEPSGAVTWVLSGQDEPKFNTPTYAKRFANGNTLVVHTSNRQMLEYDAAKQALWKFMLPFDRPAGAARPVAKSE
jgi:hypothetical protein